MTTPRLGRATFAAGVLCLVLGGLGVVARTLGVRLASAELTTGLAVLGVILLAIGVSMGRSLT